MQKAQPSQLKVYVNPAVSLNIMGEKDIYQDTNSGWCFSCESTGVKIEHLSIRLTQHRLILFHPTNKTGFNFEFYLEDLAQYHHAVSS